MDKNLIEKYKEEMMKMYRSSPNSRPVNKDIAVKAQSTGMEQPQEPTNNSPMVTEKVEMSEDNSPKVTEETEMSVETKPINPNEPYGENGRLVGIITTIRSLYPVPNAKVTIFKGEYDEENLDIITTGTSDESGKTIPFELFAPPRNLSIQVGAADDPYEVYNMLVKADGYIDNIHMNIPIFRGVTSLQQSNLVLRSAGDPDAHPFIYDESIPYNL